MTRIAEIQRAVAAHYGLTREAMLGDRRTTHHTAPRYVAIYLAHRITGQGCRVLGRAFQRDHTAISNGLLCTKALVASDAAFRAHVERLEQGLGA